ncbi:MAG: efflux transporter periplasmic adaptor subunit [Bacteroidetes bacterium]|nr:MAG: efflux transporter periplasmic adaptor subunit [Bacteroidota bacterium]
MRRPVSPILWKGLKLSVPIFLVFIQYSCNGKKDPPAKAPNAPTVVDVMVAATHKIDNTIEANGTVVANESVELHPEATGRITYLYIPEGTRVAKGTLLVRINDADLQAQLAKSKVQLDLAQKTEERLRKLLAVNGVNQADYDAALNQLNGIRADIIYTQALIDKTEIRAPFDGVIGLRQVSMGAYVTAITPIATLQTTDKLKIDFTIPEQYSNLIKKGGIVEVETDALKQTRVKAVISAIETQVIQTSRNLKVRALLQGGKDNPGAFVKVYIPADESTKAVMVPSNSLIPDDKNNQIILVKSGKAVFVNVETGQRSANNVEITKGVNVGDTVVVTGVLFARPKNPLKIRSVKTLEQLSSDK